MVVGLSFRVLRAKRGPAFAGRRVDGCVRRVDRRIDIKLRIAGLVGDLVMEDMMPQIELSNLTDSLKLAQPLGSVVKTVQSDGDWLDKAVKLVDGVNKTMETVAKIQDRAAPVEAGAPLDAPAVPGSFMTPKLPVPIPAQPAKIAGMLDAILQEIEPSLNECVKANPDMPVGAFIAQLSFITVSDLKALLVMYKLKKRAR